MTLYERTGWRDEVLSERHRQWGPTLYFRDIDWLTFEYNNCIPIALMEYKRDTTIYHLKECDIKAYKYLADNSQIPFFVVYYSYDNNTKSNFIFEVYPKNEFAMHIINTECETMVESEYVRFIYKLRNKEPPKYILDKCDF